MVYFEYRDKDILLLKRLRLDGLLDADDTRDMGDTTQDTTEDGRHTRKTESVGDTESATTESAALFHRNETGDMSGQDVNQEINCTAEPAPPHSLPLVALASAPSSGNTWVRHLLEQATGISTGSYYNDARLARGGFLGETLKWNSGRTLVIKTHKSLKQSSAAIILLRNPFDRIISEYNRRTQGHVGVANWGADMQNNQEWRETVKALTGQWIHFIKLWLNTFDKPIMMSRYEDVVNDPVGEVTRMLDFLHIPPTNRRLLCITRNLEGAFHRKNDVDKTLQYAAFTPDMRRNITSVIDQVSVLLEESGFKPPYHIEELEIRN
uniref:WSC domain-containing protein 1-like n=1 Tax=Saccoglossus kowalevskii TaxID=10224 RepID=A0ABM0M5F4_SACKO|nr:PREDICTED: WSC domain-containing protein 1-like [Saccoglossus kowalevskii]